MDIQTRALMWLVKHDLQAAYDHKLPLEQRIYRLTNAVGTMLNLFEQPTTAPTTQYAPIETSPLAAEIDSMFPKTPPLSPSDQVDTKIGPAAVCSTSVEYHQWVVPWVKDNGTIHEPRGWCQKCGVLLLSDRIVVPDVLQHLSTSAKQPLNESVENSVEESATLPSNKLDEVWWPNGYSQRYGQLAGRPWHWHSGHGHEGGEIWHQH